MLAAGHRTWGEAGVSIKTVVENGKSWSAQHFFKSTKVHDTGQQGWIVEEQGILYLLCHGSNSSEIIKTICVTSQACTKPVPLQRSPGSSKCLIFELKMAEKMASLQFPET